MPSYPYHCSKCVLEFDVIKSMHDSSRVEMCPYCVTEATRIYTIPQLSPTAKAFEAHYNYGLGREVLRKRDIKEELARIKGETGNEIVEVGSDNLQSIKQKRHSYDIPQGEIDAIKTSLSGETPR